MMNEVLSVFILLTEILMILQCLQIVFNQELPFDRHMVEIIVFDFVIYMGINLKFIPIICSGIFYVLMYVFCLIKFKQTKIKTAIRMIIAFSLAGCIEGIVGVISNIVCSEYNSQLVLGGASLLALFTTFGIRKKNIVGINDVVNSKWFALMAGLAGMLFAGVLIDYYTISNFMNFYIVFLLLSLFVSFVYLYKLEQVKNEVERKKHEIKLFKLYGDTYEELLQGVRTRQHDYKNQLGAIYSMHIVANSLEELVDMQKEYANKLQDKCKFDFILTRCNNQILAGYFYDRCVKLEKEEIMVDCDIEVDNAECCLEIHELIEVWGILINNARENVLEKANVNKRIRIKFIEEANRIICEISNPSDYITRAHMGEMFELGYSSKGKHRGIGLPRVKEIISKYDKAELCVENNIFETENWIQFQINIMK